MLTNEATKIAVESGKLLIIFNINEVHQLNPNATHVTNNYYGEEFVPDDGLQKPTFHATRNPQLSKDSVLEYVMRLHPSHVCKGVAGQVSAVVGGHHRTACRGR